MSSDSDEDLDRKGADGTLQFYDLDQLTEYLLDTSGSATWDLAASCSEEHIPKLINAVVKCASAEDYMDPELVVMAALRGLSYRYKSTDLPEALGSAIVSAIRQLAGRKRE